MLYNFGFIEMLSSNVLGKMLKGIQEVSDSITERCRAPNPRTKYYELLFFF